MTLWSCKITSFLPWSKKKTSVKKKYLFLKTKFIWILERYETKTVSYQSRKMLDWTSLKIMNCVLVWASIIKLPLVHWDTLPWHSTSQSSFIPLMPSFTIYWYDATRDQTTDLSPPQQMLYSLDPPLTDALFTRPWRPSR